MSMNEIKQEINHFNIEDKLLLVEDIWNTIAATPDDLSISKDQKQQLDRRYDDFKTGLIELHDWQDVHNELKMKYK
jgi:putative addiction module component (TIGR02574 family)